MASKISNHARKLNGFAIPEVHETWAAKVLGMSRNEHAGIDLVDYDRNLGVEIKFILADGSSHTWATQEHQLKYNDDGLDCYWGFGTYQFDCSVSKIRTRNLNELEARIVRRDLYLVGWYWVRQFPSSHTSGQTEKNEWKTDFRQPARNLSALAER